MQATSEALPLPDGSGLIHIGMPKTGTTALQGALQGARRPLRELGVHNVGRGRHEMKTALTAAGTLPLYWGDRWQARWAQLAEDFRTSDARCRFWSSETLTQAPPHRIQHIADRLGPDVHVVLTLRPLAPLLASQWQEGLRRRGTQSLDAWLHRLFDAVSVDGTVHKEWTRGMPELHRFSLRRVVEEWGAVFGEERLTFVVPPPRDKDFNLRVFERLLGVPAGTLALQELDNASLPYPEAEMLRHFNIAYTQRGGEHPTWMFTVGGPGKVGLRKLTDLEPYPIRTPRWAAERANEYTAAWNEAIVGSRANVVGNLGDLLVDPNDYPDDNEPPATVSVDSAGRIADVIYQSALGHEPAPVADASSPSGANGTSPRVDEVSARYLVSEVTRRVRRRLDPRK